MLSPPRARETTRAWRALVPARPCRSSSVARAETSLPPSPDCLEHERRRTVDVAGADREDEVAGSGPGDDHQRRVLELRRPADEHPRPRLAERVDDDPPRQPVRYHLPGGVDLRHAGGVGPGKRGTQLAG